MGILAMLVFFCLLVGVFIGIARLNQKQIEKRSNEMTSMAELMGLSFNSKEDKEIVNDLKGFLLVNFVTLEDSYVVNVIKKIQHQTELFLFDTSLKILPQKSEASSSTRRLSPTVCYFKSPDMYLPKFYLKPEQFLDKVVSSMGYKDINFPDFPVFSKKYILHGEKENELKTLFMNSGVISYLERLEYYCIEGENGKLIIYKRKRGEPNKLSIEELPQFMNDCKQIYYLLSKNKIV